MEGASKFRNLLNPGLSYNVDEDGNDAINGGSQIMDSLEGPASVAGSGMLGISRLRARNTQLLADSDRRYQGKKVSSAELEEANEINDEFYDPSLAKYFLEEDTSDEDIPAKNKRKTKIKKNKKSLNSKKVQITNTKISKSGLKQINGKEIQSDSESEADTEEDEGEKEEQESDTEVEQEENKEDSDEDDLEEEYDTGDESITEKSAASFSFQDDGDYSKYTDEDDDHDDTDDDDSDGDTRSQIKASDFNTGSSDDEDEREQPAELSKAKLRKRGPKGKKNKTSPTDDSHSLDDQDPEDDEYDDSDEEPEEQDAESDGVASEEEEEDDDNVKAVDDNLTDEQSKARAVKKQLDLYDELFQRRIMMQKIVSGSHSLPQPDVFPRFLEAGPHHNLDRFKECLATATDAASSLVDGLLLLQEAILSSNPETKSILNTEGTNKNKKAAPKPPPMDDGDEEITSSEDEEKDDKYIYKKPAMNVSDEHTDEDSSSSRGVKRSLDEVEETLAKRHCAMRGYRDRVVKYWEERTRLLQAHTKTRGKSGGGGGAAYAAFEEGFSVMLNRLLADREKLLRRTQLRNVARGNMNTPIGGTDYKFKQQMDPKLDIPLASNAQSEYERYDAEIYDDTDFYSRYLEELLKYKMQRGTSKLTPKQFYDLTHKLRKTTKKVVDTRRSKGRKLKYDVVSSILQFFPMRPDKQLEQDNLCDIVSSSMFGRNATSNT